MDLLTHLKTFVRIADAGNISKAARSLHLSIAMASRHLAALEAELTVPLMRRTTRRIDLTDAGQELLGRARALLAQSEELREAVRPGGGPSGMLVVSLPVSLGLARIAPLFPALLSKYPRLRLDLRFEDHFVDLLADGIDIAIRAGVAPPDSHYILARRLATFERVLCAAPKLLQRVGPISELAALAKVPCVVMQGSARARWSFETPHGPQVVEVDGAIRTNNMLAIRDAVVAGLGVAQLPLWHVAEDLKQARLVRLFAEAQLPIVEIFGLVHRESRSSSSVRAVLSHLENELPRSL
jgi:DNA-binding transcriptional LysR family regulator